MCKIFRPKHNGKAFNISYDKPHKNVIKFIKLFFHVKISFTGFIVVASCVMTFEARDSAAKVVPARFKVSTNSRGRPTGESGRRTTSKQIFRKNRVNFLLLSLISALLNENLNFRVFNYSLQCLKTNFRNSCHHHHFITIHSH